MMGNKWAVSSERWAVKNRRADAARVSDHAADPSTHKSPSPTSHCPLPTAHPRRGVTLVELLITIAIIALISAAILGAAASSIESARESRTRSIVSKIHGLVMERWDSYATRRVDVSPLIEKAIDDWANGANLTPTERILRGGYRGQMMADARLLAMRELMKMEMPDRWSDLLNQPLQDNAVLNPPSILASVPGLTRSYYRRLAEVQYNDDNDVDRILDNEGAECLYMLVMLGTGDGEARTMFSTTEIGDVDNDGAPEFIDGWGRPIQWIRWPAGFVQQSVLMTGDADADHDPFDAFRRDSPTATTPQLNMYPGGDFTTAVAAMRARNQLAPAAITSNPPRFLSAFRLVPLVYSAGSDGRFDLITGRGGSESEADEEAETVMGVDPYAENADQLQMGQPNPANNGWRDNIHNHLNEY